MRCHAWAVTILLLPVLVQAADNPSPNTLTAKAVGEGWVLLFDGESTFGWTIDGEATAVGGVLRLGGKKATTARTTTAFLNFLFSCDYRPEGPEGCNLIVGKHTMALKDRPVLPTEFLEYRLDKNLETSDRPRTIEFRVPAGSVLVLRNLLLKPLNLKPIFNGKDLTGWKEFPGKKSKFTVTPEGWLNIKNGPGDLQSEGQWDDFILQIECFSNGNQLNSGVFFRCRPNEYQNGYEAQIHNGFRPEATKEYTIEEYDPVTHKLIDKKKVKSAAIDYGTGAIYRRVPARRQAAKDREWFTMTIVARREHLAVWVNGIQVTDWKDNRPASDNARNGCRLEKGPISLQGHDPTTNLSFRNIRIAELPTPAGKK